MDIKEIRDYIARYGIDMVYAHDAISFLLSEVEGLQNTIAQMQDVEQTVYECRMKGGDAVRHLLDSLLAENKQLKTEVERLEKDIEGLSENLFITNEGAVKLEKENAALREVVEAVREYMNENDGMCIRDKAFTLIEALEKIKGGYETKL